MGFSSGIGSFSGSKATGWMAVASARISVPEMRWDLKPGAETLLCLTRAIGSYLLQSVFWRFGMRDSDCSIIDGEVVDNRNYIDLQKPFAPQVGCADVYIFVHKNSLLNLFLTLS